MNKNIYPDGEPKRCQFCRCKQLKEKITDTLDGHTIMEKYIVCEGCNKQIAYWAHGHWMP